MTKPLRFRNAFGEILDVAVYFMLLYKNHFIARMFILWVSESYRSVVMTTMIRDGVKGSNDNVAKSFVDRHYDDVDIQ